MYYLKRKEKEKMEKARALLKSLLASYLLTGILLLILAFIMLKLSPSNDTIQIGIVFSYIFSSFVGGLLMGKQMKVKRFLWGVLLGICYFIVIFLISILLNKNVLIQGMELITVFSMCGLGGMLGGMLS